MTNPIKLLSYLIIPVIFICSFASGQSKDPSRELKRLNAKIDRVRVMVDSLELDRLNKLGLLDSKITINGPNVANSGIDNQKFKFYKTDLEDKTSLLDIFKQENFDSVCNLAAQAGVRYSVTNPEKYIETNHDYDVPAIISFQANANESYGNWLNDQLN